VTTDDGTGSTGPSDEEARREAAQPPPPQERSAQGDRSSRGEKPIRPEEQPTPEEPRTPLTQQVGRATVVLLAVLFAVFAVANSHPVTFSWILGGTEVITDAQGEPVSGGIPLIVLMLASFAAGALIGSVATWQAGRSRRARREREGLGRAEGSGRGRKG